MKFENGYALTIGIANYPHVNKLPDTVLKDARDVHAVLKSESCGYPESHLKLLLDQDATAAKIRQEMGWLCGAASTKDTVIVYISSHGGRLGEGPETKNFLVPYDAVLGKLMETAIPAEEMTAMLRQIPARRVLVLFDFCFSGGAGEPKALGGGLKSGYSEPVFDMLAEGRGRVVVASSRADEVSRVMPGMDNSLFTHYLLKALQGDAFSRGDGLIRVFDIFHYVADQVKTNAGQHPVFKAADLEDNFPVALFRGGKELASSYQPDSTVTTAVNRTRLREFIIEYFSLDDLELVCADIQEDLQSDGIKLKISLDVVGGNGLPIRAQNLIDYLNRRGYLSYLLAALRKSRPGLSASWLAE